MKSSQYWEYCEKRQHWLESNQRLLVTAKQYRIYRRLTKREDAASYTFLFTLPEPIPRRKVSGLREMRGIWPPQ
jgi:hypothetical protein